MEKVSSYPSVPLPLGASKISPNRYRFALYASQATEVILALTDENSEVIEVPLYPDTHRTGAIWHIEIEGISDQSSYAFRVHGPKKHGMQYSFKEYLADPYAKNIHSPQSFGSRKKQGDYAFCYLKEEPFPWDGDQPLHLPKEEMIIYEMHVRSFTQSSSSRVHAPGTFLGIIEKIDHLHKLGINAVELLPIFEFDETAHPFRNSKFPYLCNYWGYAPLNFFSPCRRYAYASDPCAPSREFKTLVKTLHQEGIEVILDVVFNHTGLQGTTCSLPWIDTPSYYILDAQGHFTNYSGCGNTLNTNRAPTTQWILDILRYWVEEMHVDGFRFDLASVFSRGPSGSPLQFAPVLEAISFDPLLASTKIIAEPWDAGGLYQVGYFPTLSPRWSEWNGPYRDNVKAFLNGDQNLIGTFASRISGSQDIYPHGSPTNSINYVSCHDGFTLCDTVTYNHKHNEANGEDNRDGTDANYSYNFGTEGKTEDPGILEVRERQLRNFFLTLMVSQGIPMIQSGDEYAHTAEGNNNRWALDSNANYFLWDQLTAKPTLMHFLCDLIAFRKKYKTLFNRGFLSNKEISWVDAMGNPMTWRPGNFLAFKIKSPKAHVYVAFHVGAQDQLATLPKASSNFLPYQIVAESQQGFVPQNVATPTVSLQPHTTLIAISHAKEVT
ncbi:glycogen hydrolase (debranching) [Chlamydia pneumoniae TW-183]|uniref:Glycogen Hydrolase (Debranching) n=2 Tax=Chlamydia pneumoniae TaxID=83558 RepID=Q9Z8F5_CHLPN|nr:glycogen-debranching protein [Chlamydia pneumoniae]AAD18532.1 Glycogen Hydrolase (debranching) [Chlamydia pneumoniae CWL029]AAF38216.1 glycosyl hydrolase family protein [Chlamydia pneumoniae AR39]AAP98331.1 glycogen hydrolase (debranching) [Chlamydia pneumoniae TW-183]CRI32890.1 Isoamylase 3, chloroplastic [Chlamydia pneumoniae]CRI35753.1 Isoamylase 3, chloroplastic [Chlamydia pneumoniae]